MDGGRYVRSDSSSYRLGERQVMSVRTGCTKSMAVLVKKESDESLDDLEDTRRTIESAESRARLGRKKSEHKIPSRSDREFAQALHREADQLYQSGDYESALVLFHRAAIVYPRDSSHSIAARRTSATISSWNNTAKAQRKLLPNAGDQGRLAASVCPELAAVKASNALKISPTPASVSEVLSYFDNHKQFWQSLPSPRGKNDRLTQSRAMLKQLNGLANLSLKNLEAAFTSGKITAALKIAEELLTLSTGFPDPRHYQIAAYHYLSLIHISLGRHDRASSSVSKMVQLSKTLENDILFCRSLVTVGKVHLSFGHLEAAARAWQNLAHHVTEPIPLAWLEHEIGRCYLETGRHSRALEMAIKCTKTARNADSKKWLLYGNLLLGQALAKMGRFAEALEQLKIVVKITKDEGDTPMLSYVQDLIEQVTHSLRKIVFDESGEWRVSCSNILENSTSVSRRKESPGGLVTLEYSSKEDALMTTVFSRTQRVTEIHNGTSSSEEFLDAGGEITTELLTDSKREEAAYQETRKRSDERITDGQDDLLPGSTTFRIRSLSQSSSSSSESIHTTDSVIAKDLVVESSEFDSATTSFDDQREDSNLTRSSTGSLKSAGTNLTYVVKHKTNLEREIPMKEKVLKEEEKNKRKFEFNEVLLKKYNLPEGVLKGTVDYPSMMEALKELDKKDEQELLVILKNLLLGEEKKSELCEAFRSPIDTAAAGVSKDTIEKGSKRTRTRSCEDPYHKLLENRALFKHSLPPSPRDYELETHTYSICDTYRKIRSNTV